KHADCRRWADRKLTRSSKTRVKKSRSKIAVDSILWRHSCQRCISKRNRNCVGSQCQTGNKILRKPFSFVGWQPLEWRKNGAQVHSIYRGLAAALAAKPRSLPV